MTNTYKIYPLEDWSRIDEIQDLFKNGLGETDSVHWTWKYSIPNGLPDRKLLIVENLNGSIIGMVGLQPLIYQMDNKKYTLVQMQDLIISPDYRGSGVMRIIYDNAKEYCMNLGYNGFIQHPNDNSYKPLIKYGAKDLGDIFSINSPKEFKLFKKKHIVHVDKKEFNIHVYASFKEITFISESEPYMKLLKNSDFLRWRFEKNPEMDFQFLYIYFQGNVIGYFIFNTFKGRFNTAVNVYDFEISNQIPFEALKETMKVLSSYGNWVSIWGRLSKMENELFEKLGFRKSNGASHFTVHLFENEILDKWRITRADLDF